MMLLRSLTLPGSTVTRSRRVPAVVVHSSHLWPTRVILVASIRRAPRR